MPETTPRQSPELAMIRSASRRDVSKPTIKESVRCPLLNQDAEAWIRCCTARFLPLARRVAGDDAVAHDALQESWIIVLQKLRQYQGGPPACAWVAAVVRHEVVHSLKAERRELPLDESEGESTLPWQQSADAASPEARAYASELTRVLLEVINELPPAFRDVVRLRDLEDRPPEEVASRLHLSRQNVAVRLHRAHRLLRSIVERRLAGRREPPESGKRSPTSVIAGHPKSS